jgi:hypothetical protein
MVRFMITSTLRQSAGDCCCLTEQWKASLAQLKVPTDVQWLVDGDAAQRPPTRIVETSSLPLVRGDLDRKGSGDASL